MTRVPLCLKRGVSLAEEGRRDRRKKAPTLLARLPPRPEFHLEGTGEPSCQEIEYAFSAAQDLRLTGHLRLQKERTIVDPGCNQNGLGVDIGPTESGGARGRLTGGTEDRAGTAAGINLSDRGNRGDRAAKSLFRMRSGLECH